MSNKIDKLHGDQRMDALVHEGEPVVISKFKLIMIVLISLLTGACFGSALMLEYIPWR